MTLISFAQNQEDVMLWRALGHVRNGFYIDVGAADPVDLSVTKLFYDHGWHGINLEPQSAYFASLCAARPRDINLQLAADREAASRVFHRIDGTGLSTFDAEIAARHRTNGWSVAEETVDTRPLVEICEQHRPHDPIHFLKIDVEGAEGDVLAGADFRRFRPWIVLVEATLPLSQEESRAWEPLLTSQGYSFAWFDGLNRFYLADEKKDELGKHFHVQPNVFDNAFYPPVYFLQRAKHAEQELQQALEQAAQQTQHVHERAAQEIQLAREQATHVREQAAQEIQLAHEQATHVREQAAQEIQLAHEQAAHVREQAAETLREADATSRQATTAVEQFARTADAANHRSAEAMQQMQHMAHTLNETIRQTQAALDEQTRRSREAQLTAQQSQEQVAAILGSTSWRVTAPLRMVRRVGPTKQFARQVFHRSARFALGLPGGQQGIRFARAIAPGPIEWLARRYRVYEQTAAMQHQALPVANTVTAPAPPPPSPLLPPAPPAAITTGFSPEEARLYQQLITANPAIAASA